jgi:dienelactone hydrolase
VIPRPRPTRYGHVLRRLIANKTSAINFRVAERLAGAGLVVIAPDAAGSTVKVTLTTEGKRVAVQARQGKSILPLLKKVT